MNIVLRKTGISIQPERAEPISDDEIKKGLKAGTLEQVDHSIYREIKAPAKKTRGKAQTYKTRDMESESKAALNSDEADAES